jgi:hypothetical protein
VDKRGRCVVAGVLHLAGDRSELSMAGPR